MQDTDYNLVIVNFSLLMHTLEFPINKNLQVTNLQIN